MKIGDLARPLALMPIHGPNPERFTKYPDGRAEKPKAESIDSAFFL